MGTAGQKGRPRSSAEAFNAALVAGRVTAAGFTKLARDDDGAGGTDSLLEFTIPENGTYSIRNRSLNTDRRGPYSLQLERMRSAGR